MLTRLVVSALSGVGIVVVATGVRAQTEDPSCAEAAEQQVRESTSAPAADRVEPTRTLAPKPWVGHLFGAIAVGRGLRFNNPFRLATPLGDSPESLSLTATYLDLSLGAALGRAPGAAHGLVGHASVALHGVAQQTLTPSYVQLWRVAPRWMLLGRAGVPVVMAPDVNAGLEGALGVMWFGMAGMGLTAELVGSMFYGAATRERDPTGIPVVSLQLGAFLNYEVIR